MREASSRQKNIGMLPRFPSHSRSLLRARRRIWGNAAMVQRAPELPLSSPPSLFPCSFLSEPNEGTPVPQRCPPPSQLSFHWLHMKNNETSSETRLQKKGGWGGECSKGVRNCGIKKKKLKAFVSSLWPLSLGRFVDLLS